MVELTQKTPCAGLLPVTYGDVTLEEVNLGPITSLSAFDDLSKMAAALKKAHGLSWPKPQESHLKDDVRCLWFGRKEVLLTGVAPDESLRKHGAVVDQSDAWAVVSVNGEGTTDVLARLVPVDLRDSAMPVGATVRSQVQHMQGSITKLASDEFIVMVFRSMATTLVHDMKQAMAAVATRK
ncbi:Sarcosine oxidase, gamma subunit family protein [Sulfitobacter noctilucicola]|uniref:Sarcosine oxidase subunit gamma n=1 Tax=Sulfitobacter noctilucicola TaxID=1342301 RepID=A0A7W6MB46_9RHOB|nr:sarcosine oxidase subunit gamma family protein [Sulfitobacter noctilucicola]KIN63982.1 Sarcosine oxidase, gamma subunit family protein [Sulfitobacter noctilucicola]MBB4175338.1 sarcosine oxidase subunit gamma [Sulfitobacter noctilucicola]